MKKRKYINKQTKTYFLDLMSNDMLQPQVKHYNSELWDLLWELEDDGHDMLIEPLTGTDADDKTDLEVVDHNFAVSSEQAVEYLFKVDKIDKETIADYDEQGLLAITEMTCVAQAEDLLLAVQEFRNWVAFRNELEQKNIVDIVDKSSVKAKKSVSDVDLIKRFLVYHGVRNTILEDLHSGVTPSSESGDYRDVKVVTPYGEIEWSKLSRLSDLEMRELMLSIEKHILQALLALRELGFVNINLDQAARKAMIQGYYGEHGVSYDDPTLSTPKGDIDKEYEKDPKDRVFFPHLAEDFDKKVSK